MLKFTSDLAGFDVFFKENGGMAGDENDLDCTIPRIERVERNVSPGVSCIFMI